LVLPNFLMIGSMKAGTTSLYEYLRTHPQVFMSERKELDYFTTGIDGGLDRDWYEGWFQGADGARAVGEASTGYTKFPTHRDVAARVAALLPDVRLIYMIRNPIERMRSQWVHEVWMGKETRPIERALIEDPRYVEYSRYALQLEQYLACFRSEQILILSSEALRDSRRATIERVFEFLDVQSGWWSPELEREHHQSAPKRRPSLITRKLQHVGGYRALAARAPMFAKRLNRRALSRPMTAQSTVLSDGVRRRLESMLQDDVVKLGRLLGDGFAGWEMASGSG
jgi:hypothetical protein